MGSTMKHLVFWMVAALVVFMFWSVSSRIQKNERHLSFSELLALVESGNVKKVTLAETGAGTDIFGELKNSEAIRSFAPSRTGDFVETMISKGVEVSARDARSGSWLGHLISWTPIVIMIAFLVSFMRSMQRSTPGTMSAAERQERRLELKTRLFRALSESASDLSEDEILWAAAKDGASERGDGETQKALYQMISEGTVVVTDDKKYRLRTTT